jgi:hypothetical protein
MKTLGWLVVIFTVDCWGAAPDVDFGRFLIKDKLRNGTGSISTGTSFAIDGKGQYYVSGYFDRDVKLFGTNILTNAHRFHPDAFIAKYDRQTNCVWVRQIHEAAAPSVAAFGTEAVFVAGWFKGDTLVGTLPISSHGSQDAFLAKFDTNGNLLWFKQAGGCEKRFSGRATSVTTDAAGNSYITGEFSGPGCFDEITLSPQGVPRALFVAKYDPAGKLLWAKKDAEGSTDPNGIAVDSSGNIYITGDFFRTVAFGSQILTQIEGCDMFLAKYDAGGNSLWTRPAGGPPKRIGWTVAVDSRGDPYVAGLIFGTSAFGSTNVVIANKRHPNSFVAKYNAGGDFQWVRQLQDGDFDFSNVVGVEMVGVKQAGVLPQAWLRQRLRGWNARRRWRQ